MIDFGAVGLGYVATRSMLPAIRHHASLHAIHDVNEELCRKTARQLDTRAARSFDELLSMDIDAVYIATPIGTHFELARQALEAGKHVLCEKTLTGNFELTRTLAALAQERDLGLLEGFMYRFHPQHQTVLEMIDNDEIGNIVHVDTRFGFPPLDRSNFRYNPDMGGGATLDAGAYTLHGARMLLRQEPHDVYAVLSGEDGFDVEIHGSVFMNFTCGATALAVYGFHNFYQNTYAIWGTKGKLSTSRAFSLPPDFEPVLLLERQGERKEYRIQGFDHFKGQVAHFCENLHDPAVRESWRDDLLHQAHLIEQVKSATCTIPGDSWQ